MKDSANTSCMQDFVGKLKIDMLDVEGTKYLLEYFMWSDILG